MSVQSIYSFELDEKQTMVGCDCNGELFAKELIFETG